MGRPASFELTWAPAVGGRFVRLDLANYFGAGEARQPVLQAVGYYPESGSGAGTWVDSRGVIFALDVTSGERELRVSWRGERERGESVYALTSDSTLEVTDRVEREGGLREFARATLRRAE